MTAPTLQPRLERLSRAQIYLIATPPLAAEAADSEAGRAWLGKVGQISEAGVGLVQLRIKSGSSAERLRWLAAFRERLAPQTLLILNDDLAALVAGAGLADGLHLGRGDARLLGEGDIQRGLQRARRELDDELLLGTSTRTLEEVTRAVAAGVDHVGFGAMAPSGTKAQTTPAEPAELRRCLEAYPTLPIYPIGGICLRTLPLLTAAFAPAMEGMDASDRASSEQTPTRHLRRAAMASALLDAVNPGEAAAQMLDWSRGS